MIYNLLSESLDEAFDISALSLDEAYDITGKIVFSKEGGGGGEGGDIPSEPIDKYKNYNIEMLSYLTPCGQDFAYYDGKLVAATETSDVLRVIDAITGTRLENAFTVSGIGHCNQLVFSNEFYDENDVFPLICTINGKLLFYRITNTFDSAELIKSYILETPPVDTSTRWYGLGWQEGYLYTIGYTSGSYQASSNNFILLAKYDYSNPRDNGDGTFTIPLLSSKRREWFECIQGSQLYDGYFWVNSGFTSQHHVYALNLESAEIVLDIVDEAWTLEPEALSWQDSSTLLIGTKNKGSNTGMYKITFPDAKPNWYPHYKSHISTIDGLYSGFNYSNVYIIGNELIVGYLAKKHHFTDMSEKSQIFRVARKNLTTGAVTEIDAITGIGYCGSVYYDGVYYIFDSFKNRYTTVDWINFSEPVKYTLPSGASEPYYITVGENGRFISTTSKAVKGSMLYSDDLGLTWAKATGGDSANTDHGGTCKVENTLVAYCQNSAASSSTDTYPRRYVLTSEDNGLTWSEKLCEDEDLVMCGGSHASGAFCSIGDEWFYAAGNRTQWTDSDGYIHLGTIQLFKGSAQDVLNGSMHLYSVLDDLNTGYKSIGIPTSTTWTDTGNLGMTTDGENLYCVYMRPLFHVADCQSYNVSNCMVALSVVDRNRNETDSADDYYNPNWDAERTAAAADHDTNHDLYIYVDGDSCITNYSGDIYSKSTHSQMNNTFVQPKDDILIPFNSYFEMCFVGSLREVLGEDGSTYQRQYIGVNINGEDIGITGTTNSLYYPKTHQTLGGASTSARFGGLLYLKIKYENGVISTTLNDITINNLKSRTYYVINESENTILMKCTGVSSKIEGGSYKWGMIQSFWVDTDGDLTGLVQN